MARVRLYRSLSDAPVSLAGSASEIADLGVQNLLTDPLFEFYRITGGGAPSIKWGFGGGGPPSAFSCCVLAGIAGDVGNISFVVNGATSEGALFSGAQFSTGTLSLYSGTPAQFATWPDIMRVVSFAPQPLYPWWGVQFISGVPSLMDIGRIFLGDYFEPTHDARIGWSIEVRDRSQRSYGTHAQVFVDPRGRHRVGRLVVRHPSDAEAFGLPQQLARTLGASRAVAISGDETASGNLANEQAIYGYLAPDQALTSVEVKGVFDREYVIEEAPADG